LEEEEERMPVYTYRCGNCGIQFDRHLKYTDKPLTRCPECSKKSLKKVISPVRVVFKGSGFYATDHKSPSGQKDSHSSKPEKPKETEVKAESKTETKTESTPAKSTSETKE
jgi:putative FmdB family regulatory protein